MKNTANSTNTPIVPSVRYMDIWMADLPVIPGHVKHGTRPVVIVSNDDTNAATMSSGRRVLAWTHSRATVSVMAAAVMVRIQFSLFLFGFDGFIISEDPTKRKHNRTRLFAIRPYCAFWLKLFCKISRIAAGSPPQSAPGYRREISLTKEAFPAIIKYILNILLL